HCYRRDLLSFPTRRSSDLEFYRVAEGYEKADFRRMVRAIEKKYGIRPQSEQEKNLQAETLDFEEETEYIDEREVMKHHRILMQSDRKSTRLNSSHVKISYA